MKPWLKYGALGAREGVAWLGSFVLWSVWLALSLLLTLATTGLLVSDLERPERFLRILTRPQWRSWLTRGAFLLIAFSLVLPLWLLIGTWLALMGLTIFTVTASTFPPEPLPGKLPTPSKTRTFRQVS